MQAMTRRDFLQAIPAGLLLPRIVPSGCTLSIGTYSLKGLSLDDGIDVVTDIGYDGLELAVFPGHEADPAQLSPARQQEIRRRLAQSLHLTALMENLSPAVSEAQHQADLIRLRRVLDLGQTLAPFHPPLVQTVLGSGTWEAKKTLFRDRLADWLGLFREARMVLAIKPHRGGALSQPAEALWLWEQLDRSPWLRMVYDYSHYAFRNLSVEQTVQTALPMTAHVVVKDAVQVGERVEFRLPGASGTFDYADLLRRFHTAGYRGDVCVEVSSMVFSKPGYQAEEAARSCYRHLAAAFAQARIPRG